MLLNLHSYYSLRYGTLSLSDLVDAVLAGGYETAVLTDINNSAGVLDAVSLARRSGLNMLVGMEYRHENELRYIGVARNAEGYKELNEWMTRINQGKAVLTTQAPDFDCVFVIYPYGKRRVEELRDYEYIGIRPGDLSQIVWDDQARLQRYVILAPVSFRSDQYKLHKQLRSVAHNILISQLQPGQVACPDEYLITKAQLLDVYKQFPTLIVNTNRLLAACSFDFDFSNKKNKQVFTTSPYEDKELLAKYTREGFAKRYLPTDQVAKDRMRKELEMIEQFGFSSYFLITDDLCRYARERDFHYVGRGSGANSLVAYCLGITNVCPIELNLYFERFLNPKRKNPPDFDIDFSWDERDEMYKYIFERYPAGNVALMGTMSTFQGRSVIRELGKVYGLPKAEIDRLLFDPQNSLNRNEVTDLILSVCSQIKDFPNQRSIHASGVLISELPLTHYAALDFPPKGFPTVQFDMYVAEDIGFDKFDILSQRGIGHIKDCRRLIKQNQGKEVSTSDPKSFFSDPKIAAQLRQANTIGCFYIESPAMRQLIAKLNCDNYLTLVAASSIIRPGVASSGMMKNYIERHHSPDEVTYPHPVFQEHLGETYGVMVYQEDVMKIGHYYGGLDLADADVLRRMMNGKYRHKEDLLKIEAKFFAHCAQMGYPEQASREVWRQMESFAGFSFNKAHSASFAVESYQSLYLKTYFPLEFMVAVLNNYGGFYRRKVYVSEARKAGAEICLPCVNKSVFNTTIYGRQVYLGFDCLANLETQFVLLMLKEREQNGEFSSLQDFVFRTQVGLAQLLVLVRIGAFRFTGMDKKALLWEAHLLLSGEKRAEGIGYLFECFVAQPVLPKLESSILEDMFDEMELLGFPVSASLFDMARSAYRGDVMAKSLVAHKGEVVRMVGDFVCDKEVRTKNGQRMKFGSFFDVKGDLFDTVHFSDSLLRSPLWGNGLYLLEGKIVLEYGWPALEVIRCARMPLKSDPRSE